MAYQFVRIETYCPKPTPVPHSKDQFNSTEQVFLEAERDARYSKHVAKPKPSVPIDGFGAIPVATLRKLHDTRRAAIRETVSKGKTNYQRSLKSDFPTLYTEIHSHPMTAEEYKAAPRGEKLRIHQWAQLSLLDFSKRMPEGVQFSAVLHLDEGHVHFHILAVNMADPKMSANKLHVGKLAADEYRRREGQSETLSGLPKPELKERPQKPKKPRPSKTRATQEKRDAAHAVALAEWEQACERITVENDAALQKWRAENNAHLRSARKQRKSKVAEIQAYEAALVAFQNRYYDAVGKRCGLLRNGPGTERLSTVQYHARKEQARLASDQDAAHRAEAARQAAERAQISVDTARIADDWAALIHRDKELDAAEDALLERESEIARRDAAVTAAEDSLKKKEQAQRQAETELLRREVAIKERERTLEDRHQDLTLQRNRFHRHTASRQAELDSRERRIKEQEAEVAEATSAIEVMVEGLVEGKLTTESGKLRFSRVHAFLDHAISTPPKRRSRMQRIVAKCAGFLMRAASAWSDGAAPSAEHEDSPGM